MAGWRRSTPIDLYLPEELPADSYNIRPVCSIFPQRSIGILETPVIASSKTTVLWEHLAIIESLSLRHRCLLSHADLQALQTLLGILASAVGIIMVVLSVVVKRRVF